MKILKLVKNELIYMNVLHGSILYARIHSETLQKINLLEKPRGGLKVVA